MAWRRTGDKPLSETMLALFEDAYMGQWVNPIRKERTMDAFIIYRPFLINMHSSINLTG